MAAISTEQALQIPQQLRRQGSQAGADSTGTEQRGQDVSSEKGILSDDPVSINQRVQSNPARKVAVENYKSQLGQDQTFIRETLRNKLAEYQLSPHTPLSVSKDAFGQLEIKGPALQSSLDQIAQDLNSSNSFRQAFERVSQQEPTLNYVDNVVKLSKAYGVTNNLFNTLISEDAQYNGLNDIAHRYQAMKATAPIEETGGLADSQRFEFSLNA